MTVEYCRIVFPALTRNRSYNNTPQSHVTEYYSQRATNGGLLISEAAAASDISKEYVDYPSLLPPPAQNKGVFMYVYII